MIQQYRDGLDAGKPQARAALGLIGNQYTVDWSEYLGADWSEPVKTAVDMGRLRALGKAITTYPSDWTLHPRVPCHHAGSRANGVRRSRARLGLCGEPGVCQPGAGRVSHPF